MMPGYYHQVLKQAASPQAKRLLAYRLTPEILQEHERIVRDFRAICARGSRKAIRRDSKQQEVDSAIIRMRHLKAEKIFRGEAENPDRLWIGMIPFNQTSHFLFDDDGPFREQLAPFCFNINGNVSLLSDHIASGPCGFTFTKTLDVWQTKEGLWFQYPHNGPGEPPVHAGLSPCLRNIEQKVEYIRGTRIHTVIKSELPEISIISDWYGGGPAYPGTRIVC